MEGGDHCLSRPCPPSPLPNGNNVIRDLKPEKYMFSSSKELVLVDPGMFRYLDRDDDEESRHRDAGNGTFPG